MLARFQLFPAPMFVIEYAFCSFFLDLQYYQAEITNFEKEQTEISNLEIAVLAGACLYPHALGDLVDHALAH